MKVKDLLKITKGKALEHKKGTAIIIGGIVLTGIFIYYKGREKGINDCEFIFSDWLLNIKKTDPETFDKIKDIDANSFKLMSNS